MHGGKSGALILILTVKDTRSKGIIAVVSASQLNLSIVGGGWRVLDFSL